ncbi:MAG: diaminopimelate decarboxylase, partial [Acidobacteriaceae bacterium]|nr:diaminopimelate decarboxylase [Acidobacteriaceae bacterium]
MNDAFRYENGTLVCEQVDLASIGETYGTPAYVYSSSAIRARFRAYQSAFSDLSCRICYSVKANSNLSVLRLLAEEGSGFDIVSGGELYRVLKAGGDGRTVVFSGVGKAASEIRFALAEGIHSFNCESESEIETISGIANSLGRTASIAIRVNPDVDAITHPYISTGLREHKFGVSINAAEALYHRAAQLPSLLPDGVSCHIGSQLLDLDPLVEAADKALRLIDRLRSQGIPIRNLDLGGGLGVPYRSSERAISIE